MKLTICFFLVCAGFVSCTQKGDIKDKKSNDTIQISDSNRSNIFVKDKSMYDPKFLEGLKEYKEPIKLVNDFVITGADTARFPNDLPLNKEIHFRGERDGQYFVLNVTRTNLTNLKYDFELIKNSETVRNKSGKAILTPMFFLASEMDDDSQTEEGYGSSEYWDKSNNCWVSLRIGIGKDESGKLRALITYGCENSTEGLTLQESPTLRTE